MFGVIILTMFSAIIFFYHRWRELENLQRENCTSETASNLRSDFAPINDSAFASFQVEEVQKAGSMEPEGCWVKFYRGSRGAKWALEAKGTKWALERNRLFLPLEVIRGRTIPAPQEEKQGLKRVFYR
jgi:hypothetical protein